MLEEFFEHLAADKRSRGNPLVGHLSPFAASLIEDSYAEATMRSKLWLLTDFGHWLGRRGLAVTQLDEQLVETFFVEKRRRGRVHRGNQETVRQFLDHLRERSVVAGVTPPTDASPLTDILNRYETHLRSERGLATATIISYLPSVRKFLVERFAEVPFRVREVRSSDISAFILRHARTIGCRTAQLMTTAFRSFFRFLFQNGNLESDLATSVPTVADWRLATVPKYLTRDEVSRALGSCDRQTATGRRDYAILLLLARLGLRAGEIVALQLDDIGWRAGEILVRGKGLLHDRMPCLWMSVKHLPPICAGIVPDAKRVGFSFA
jgi:integrase/recombinase XerD